MTRASLIALLLLLTPGAAFAASVEGARALVVSEPIDGNAYLVGGDITVTSPLPGDVLAGAGTVMVSAPAAGDALLIGGTVAVQKPVAGDVRILGGKVIIDGPIAGDLVALAGTMTVRAPPHFAHVIGATVSFEQGAKGPVTIYGSTVTLAGEFSGDVTVTATDRLTLLDGTVIKGALRYDAPQEATIAASTTVEGGVTYTGSSYLPSAEEARTFAIAGASIFFIIRILAALIGAGVIAGLFPRLAQAVADETLGRSPLRFLLLVLLGFALMVATPVLIILLLVTFAGAALALMITAAYVLLLLLAYFFAAVIAGSALMRSLIKRPRVFWRDAIVGMLALYVVYLVPILGPLVFLVMCAASVGTLGLLLYRFAFPRGDEEYSLS